MNYRIHVTILATILTGTLPFFANTARANGDDASLVSVEFRLPDDPLPHTSINGGGRREVKFSLPPDAPPNGSFGGRVRGDSFVVPPENEKKPDRSVGTGLDSDLDFSLPSGFPNGGVRDDLFFHSPEDEGEPKEGTFGSGVRNKVLLAATATSGSRIGGGVRSHVIPLTPLVAPNKDGSTGSDRF